MTYPRGRTPSGANRANRGGSFRNTPTRARCAYRNRNRPSNQRNNQGFRVALPSAPQPDEAPDWAPAEQVRPRWRRAASACRPTAPARSRRSRGQSRDRASGRAPLLVQ